MEIAPNSKFTPELFDEICTEIAYSDKGLVTLCKSKSLSAKTFYDWIKNDEELRNKYARARELQADYLADQIIEIADDGSKDEMPGFVEGSTVTNWENIQRSKLRVDARKWKASKLYPKKYSEKTDITSGGEKIVNAPNAVAAVINFDGAKIELLE